MNFSNRKNGFTLIELLIVIAIIGILASVVLASLNSARVKARDAQRVLDLHQIKNALMLYYDDHGVYPDFGDWVHSNVPAEWATLSTALAPYMKVLPVDPANTGTSAWSDGHLVYMYQEVPPNFQEYDLIGQFEDQNNKNRNELTPYIHHYYGTPWEDTYHYMFADH